MKLAFAQDKQCQIRESWELCACGRAPAANSAWLSTCHGNALGSPPQDFSLSPSPLGAAAAAGLEGQTAPAEDEAIATLRVAGTPRAPCGAKGSCFPRARTA